jgi:hypothetical protein
LSLGILRFAPAGIFVFLLLKKGKNDSYKHLGIIDNLSKAGQGKGQNAGNRQWARATRPGDGGQVGKSGKELSSAC